MSEPAQHHGINYIEFTTTDIAKTKSFYERVFSWNFQEWGPEYISFNRDQAGIDGGFRKADPTQSSPSPTAPLVVLYSQDLKATEAAIIAAGGSIAVPTFDFPGGKRFHFHDGQGNVLAVWSE
jgi:predicted enzyme related to lactoylglutathione lyase